VRLHEVENPLLEVVYLADLHCMEVVGLREVAHNTVNMSKHAASSVDMVGQEFGIGFLGVGILERSLLVVIPPGVLLVRRDIISKFVLWTLAPKTYMPLEMMQVAILRAICKPCCYNRFATPGVAICKENVVIPSLGVGILFKGERLEYPPEYFVPYLSVCLPVLIQPLLRHFAVLDHDWQESDHYDGLR